MRTSEAYIRAATESALTKAVDVGAQSVALPAFGTGVGGFALERAATTMAEVAIAAAAAGKAPPRVVFVVRTDEARRPFVAALRESDRDR